MDLGFLPYLLLKSMAIDDEKGIGLNNIIWFLSVSIEGFQIDFSYSKIKTLAHHISTLMS
jgi:hypothetical protein